MTLESVANHIMPFVWMLFGAWIYHRAGKGKSPIPTIAIPDVLKPKAKEPEKKGPPVRL